MRLGDVVAVVEAGQISFANGPAGGSNATVSSGSVSRGADAASANDVNVRVASPNGVATRSPVVQSLTTSASSPVMIASAVRPSNATLATFIRSRPPAVGTRRRDSRTVGTEIIEDRAEERHGRVFVRALSAVRCTDEAIDRARA